MLHLILKLWQSTLYVFQISSTGEVTALLLHLTFWLILSLRLVLKINFSGLPNRQHYKGQEALSDPAKSFLAILVSGGWFYLQVAL